MVKITNITTPFSKGFSAVSTKLLINDLTEKYSSIIEPNIKVMAFKEKKDYFIYATIPSKSNEKYQNDKIYYDIVFQLIAPNGNMEKNDENIRNWDVKVFSNNPSFVYTFNYVYYSNRALINLPNGFYSKPAMKMKPKVRNPYMLLGIDEDLWFTVMYLDKNHWFDRPVIDAQCGGNDLNFKWLLKQIIPQEEKIREVQDRSLRQRNTNKKEKELERLSKNEEERKKKEEEENTRRKDKAKSSESLLNKTNLRTSNFNDLSSNLNSHNSSPSAKKSMLNKSRLKGNGLKSSL